LGRQPDRRAMQFDRFIKIVECLQHHAAVGEVFRVFRTSASA
jgi:hypothetical protein